MEDFTPRRRGRPPLNRETEGNAAIEAPAPQEAAQEAEAPKPRRRRGKLGGFSKKLEAPSKPGFVRRWFNASGNRIAEAEELGYTPVLDTKAKTPGLGSLDNRLVGTQANGEPLRAILMETPDELYAEGLAEKEAHARTVDEAISRGDGTADGQMSQIPEEERYGRGSIRSGR
jgi:hypothetical protein